MMHASIVRMLFPALGILAMIHAQGQLLYVPDHASLAIPPGDTLYVGGDALFFRGAIVSVQGSLAVGGSLTNNVDGNGTLYNLAFTGSGASFYHGNPLRVTHLSIDNPGGVTLNAPITVDNSATFRAGNFVTSPTNLLIFSPDATAARTKDASHVIGPVKYLGLNHFNFPVGDATYYRRIEVDLTGNSDGMTATYFHSAPPGGALAPPLVAVNKSEYWTLTPAGSATGTVILNWDNTRVKTGIGNFIAGELKVAHLTGGSWVDERSLDATGNAATGTVTTGVSISSWSPFALGSTNSLDAPLPLKFLGISAGLLPGGSREVDWQVADEQGVRDYTVERGPDGRVFTAAGSVAAAGSSGYMYIDTMTEHTALVYYRVRSNDLDGNASYSPVAVVRLTGELASLHIQPNPVQGQFVLSFGEALQGNYGLEIVSLDGRLVYRQSLVVSANQDITISRPPGMVRGLYGVRITRSDGAVFIYKLLFL